MRIFALIITCSILVTAFLSPFITQHGQSVILAIMSGLIATFGWTGQLFKKSFFGLLIIEILYGFPIGVVSLAWLLSLVAIYGLAKYVRIRPWSTKTGWNVYDALSAILVAAFLYHGTLILSAILVSMNSDTGYVLLRVLDAFSLMQVSIFMCVALPIMIAYRRIRMPFRRVILFGV